MLKVSRHKRPKKKKEKRISSSDDDDVPFWGALATSLVGSAVSGYSARRQAKKQRSQALKDAKYQTPEELEYVNKMRKRSQYGMDNIGEIRNQAIQPMFQQGEQAQVRATGNIIRQGMENSIVANEIRSKIDSNTQTQISDMALKVAQMNKQYKEGQEARLDNYNLERANRIRGITSQANDRYNSAIAGTGIGDIIGGALGSVGSSMLKSYVWGEDGFQIRSKDDDSDSTWDL